jgi:hypothetical protein
MKRSAVEYPKLMLLQHKLGVDKPAAPPLSSRTKRREVRNLPLPRRPHRTSSLTAFAMTASFPSSPLKRGSMLPHRHRSLHNRFPPSRE